MVHQPEDTIAQDIPLFTVGRVPGHHDPVPRLEVGDGFAGFDLNSIRRVLDEEGIRSLENRDGAGYFNPSGK